MVITQEINKYKQEVTYTTTHYPTKPPTQNHWPHFTRPTNEMGKMEFALLLRNMGYAKGDFVVAKVVATGSVPPASAIYRVSEIDEIHHFVGDWGSAYSGPVITTLESWQPIRPWKTGCKIWRKYEGPLPPEWRDVLDRENQNADAHNQSV